MLVRGHSHLSWVYAVDSLSMSISSSQLISGCVAPARLWCLLQLAAVALLPMELGEV